MIKCSACMTDNSDGSLSCSICGQMLDRHLTLTARSIPLQPSRGDPSTHTAHLGNLPEKGVAVYVGSAQEPIITSAQERVTLGRRKDLPVADLIDLTSYDAYRMGVSRNHAVLTYKDGRIYIHDVGSVNGTWIDGQRLKSYELYAIEPGTPITLGQLTIYLYY